MGVDYKVCDWCGETYCCSIYYCETCGSSSCWKCASNEDENIVSEWFLPASFRNEDGDLLECHCGICIENKSSSDLIKVWNTFETEYFGKTVIVEIKEIK